MKRPTSLRERLRQWARRRQGTDPPQVTLESRRIYVLPTAAGLLFAVMVTTMLLGAMNYNNNLGFALTFLLAALGIVTIHHCHRTLLGLRVELLGAAPVFAGADLQVQLALGNDTALSRQQLEVSWDRDPQICTDLGAKETCVISLGLPTHERGWLALPRLRIATPFPLGLVRAWAWIHLEAQGLAYPQPAAATAVPVTANDTDDANGRSSRGEEDFGGLRAFQRGDPPHRIAWKTYARTGELLVREFRGGAAADDLWIDWDAFPGVATEARIRKLTRLVLDASRAGRAWGLRIPGTVIDAGRGSEHLHSCLLCLATLPADCGEHR